MSEGHPTEATIPPHRSYLAVASLGFGLASVPLFTFVVLGLIAFVTGLVAHWNLHKLPKSRNETAMAFGGITLGFLSAVAGLFAAPTTSVTKAKATSAMATAISIELAVKNFHSEYGEMPVSDSSVKTNTPEGVKFLNVLLGREKESDNSRNMRSIKFLSVKEGKEKRNGLIYSDSGDSIEGLYDPWGYPYTVVLDSQHDVHLRFTIGQKSVDLKERYVAVFSPGPDGKPGTSDDVITW